MHPNYAAGQRRHHKPRGDHRDLDRTHRRHTTACTGALAATPTTAAATHYPAVAAAIVRIIAESATALARHKAGGQR